MGGRGASSSANSKEYLRANRPGEFALQYPEEAGREFMNRTKLQSKVLGDFVENRNVIRELEANIRAQKADNPNARVGDTRIDSGRMISMYSERLTPQEYSVFTQDAAETALFRKLRELERKAGFKK